MTKYGSKVRKRKAWKLMQERGKKDFRSDSKRKTNIQKPWKESVKNGEENSGL